MVFFQIKKFSDQSWITHSGDFHAHTGRRISASVASRGYPSDAAPSLYTRDHANATASRHDGASRRAGTFWPSFDAHADANARRALIRSGP
jgi:hypothetical protein